MVTDWLIQVGMGIATWFIGLIPNVQLPDNVLHLDTTIDSLTAALGGLSPWVPWAILFAGATLSVSTWGVCLLIKLVRAAVSYVPVVGGSG